MNYNIVPPSKELQGIVKQYIVINSLDGIDDLLFLPNGCNFIVFNRGIDGYTKEYNENNKFYIPKNYSVSVKINKVKKFVLNDTHCTDEVHFPIILVELTPIGFYKLFNINAYLLNKSYMEIESYIVEKYFKNLYTHKSTQEELGYLNNSLMALYTSQKNTNIPIEDVIYKIVNSYHFEVTVEMLVEESGYSRSTMERYFKKFVGFTPKNFIFVSKFCETVLAYAEDGYSFNKMKYLYSDSSHINSVFKKFFGVNPSLVLYDIVNERIKIHQMHKLKDIK